MNLHLLLQVLHYLLILVPPDHHHDNHEEEHHGKRLLKVANDPRDKQGNDRQEPEEVFTLACGLSCLVALLCQGSLHILLLPLWVKVGICGGAFRGVNIPEYHRGEAGLKTRVPDASGMQTSKLDDPHILRYKYVCTHL